MNLTHRNLYRIVTAVVVAIVCAWPAIGQSSNDLSPFVGRWKINLAETKMGRMGPDAPPNIVRSPTFTFVFAPSGPNLRIDTYTEYPQPAPTRSMPIVPDGKQHPCEVADACLTAGGNPNEQKYAYFRMDSHMIVRVFYIQGKVSEYTNYAVSSDGKVFTMISWSAETPQWQNIQVFDKQP